MPNIKSAKKAAKQSIRNLEHNLMWKKRIKDVIKDLLKKLAEPGKDPDIINKELSLVYKVLDKAAKKSVIHRNKAQRLKSKYAKQLSALKATLVAKTTLVKPAAKKTTKAKKPVAK